MFLFVVSVSEITIEVGSIEYHEIQTTFSTLHNLFNLFGGQQQPCIITFSAMSNKIKGQRMSEHEIIYTLS
ncbi:unnamed protein product [Rhizophagus irregularis]|nr:unnamed protein product [Rhizophagus irregularis]